MRGRSGLDKLEQVLPLLERIVVHLEQVQRGISDEVTKEGSVITYCDRLGLTAGKETLAELAPAGATLLRLRGVDRLRWLLAVETSVATSHLDPWCIDLDSVRLLAQDTGWSSHPGDSEGLPVSDVIFKRWTELGALRYWEDDQYGIYEYNLSSTGRELFFELARDDATSFRTLARAFLEDEREQVLAQRTTTSSSQDRATAATLRYARMVTHEVRNALLPVQHALEKIWASPNMATAELAEPRRRIDEGLDRLHRFVNDSLGLVPQASGETTLFSVMEAIDEARRECVPSPEGGILIEAVPASANPLCRGHRGRFVLALINLLRNSVQMGGLGVRIEISVDARESGKVTVSVRDDGPGVPEAQRDALFENGVSHRDGGAGHGLAFVRLVVEGEMHGRLRLVSEPEGGANFILEFPAEEDAR